MDTNNRITTPQTGEPIASRKNEHLDICVDDQVETTGTLLDGIAFRHTSLPELTTDDIDLGVELFGKRLSAPILVTGMTGGTERAGMINTVIAKACQQMGIAMGLGSQRAMLVDPNCAASYQVRGVAPDILLFGNIGGVQLREMAIPDIKRLVDAVEADALCVHLNPAQEMLQPEGDRDFTGVFDGIKRAVEALDGRVIVKETGAGLSPETVGRLHQAGVAMVDVSGKGGTSWTKIERLRNDPDRGMLFDAWGIPTAAALLALEDAPLPRIGSGGVRTGLDIARCISLGATLGGMALPALKAAEQGGVDGVVGLFETLIEQLTFVCINTGSRTPTDLRKRRMIVSADLARWVEELRGVGERQMAFPRFTLPERRSSRIGGFFKLSMEERLEVLAERLSTSVDELAPYTRSECLPPRVANELTENAIGTFAMPFGLGLNFLIDGQDYFLPMAVEEPSVVAAISRAAKIVRAGGGFTTNADRSITVAQIHLTDLADPKKARLIVEAHADDIIAEANALVPRLVKRKGGVREVSVRVLRHEESGQEFVTVHLHTDVVDAMGANICNTIAEGIAPRLVELTGGRVVMRILSNLADERLARATFDVPFDALAFGGLSGEDAARRIEESYRIADIDPYRAVTHNKGVLNGIDAAGTALGQDIRALEAAAHAYAARSGQYRPLTSFQCTDQGTLRGAIEIPMQVSTVSPIVTTHPAVNFAHRILGVKSAQDLARVLAAAGLAQNLAACQALISEGIQKGHMALHSRRVK